MWGEGGLGCVSALLAYCPMGRPDCVVSYGGELFRVVTGVTG